MIFFARIGGDEFAIYIRSKRSIHECEQKAEQLATAILDAVSRPFNIENNQLSISASVGLALYPRDAKDYGELMQFADTAMYHAKDTGRNRHVFYFGEIVESAKHRFLIERELRNAIGNNEITLAYQPIVESGGDNVIEGFEVLSRWIHPELGFIPPDEFIKVAEETGLIGGYTLRLLDRACKKILHWNQLADKAFMLSINISPVHFLHDDLASSILETLEQNAFQPEHLKIEITENVLIENSDHVLKILNTLKKSGVKVSIDDFGTGYSSIGYLKSYPLDFIKIDRSFVIDTPINTDNKNICSVIKDLAGYMNLKVIAEGVENGENSRFLESIQIEYMQGYHFSKPMSAEFWDNYFL
jgi:predicted signal transduction protein with EAL and GGDEF domain